VQHSAHLVGRQVNVGRTIVTLDKAMTVTVARNRALEFSEEPGGCASIVAAVLAAGLMSCFDKSLLFRSFMEFGKRSYWGQTPISQRCEAPPPEGKPKAR